MHDEGVPVNQSSASAEAIQPVKSADRALTILETLARSEDKRSLAELAAELSLPRSSLHGLLRTLERRGWVEADASDQRFGLGVRALLIGDSYVNTDVSVLRAQPAMDMLSERSGETVHLGRLDGSNIVYLAKRESIHPLRLYSAVGRRLPAHATALGKALLAERPAAEVAAIVGDSLAELTPNTITRREHLDTDLSATRARGYAIDDEENSAGIRCFAVALAPVNRKAHPTDALSVSVPIARMHADTEAQVTALLAEARDLYERKEPACS